MRDFRKIKVWQKAHAFALDIYAMTQSFPPEERYGLTSQIRRASVSIPTNISEGCGRRGDAELARFMQIGMGSASEVEYLLLFAHDLGIIQTQNYRQMNMKVIELKKMLSSFIKAIRQSNKLTS